MPEAVELRLHDTPLYNPGLPVRRRDAGQRLRYGILAAYTRSCTYARRTARFSATAEQAAPVGGLAAGPRRFHPPPAATAYQQRG
jgi:hypothetical protein